MLFFDNLKSSRKFGFCAKGWIHLNVETMPKILLYLITLKLLSSNVRFWASFRRLEESTQKTRSNVFQKVQCLSLKKERKFLECFQRLCCR